MSRKQSPSRDVDTPEDSSSDASESLSSYEASLSSAYSVREDTEALWHPVKRWGFATAVLFVCTLWVWRFPESFPVTRAMRLITEKSSTTGDSLIRRSTLANIPTFTATALYPTDLSTSTALPAMLSSFFSVMMNRSYENSHTGTSQTSCTADLTSHDLFTPPASLEFVSLLPYDLQQKYFEQRLHHFLALGPRVAGRPRCEVKEFLIRPLQSSLISSMCVQNCGPSTTGHLSLSERGEALARQWRILSNSSETVTSFSSSLKWGLEVDRFNVTAPVNLFSDITSPLHQNSVEGVSKDAVPVEHILDPLQQEPGDVLTGCEAHGSEKVKPSNEKDFTAEMENYVFHLPAMEVQRHSFATPSVLLSDGASPSFSRWISSRKKQLITNWKANQHRMESGAAPSSLSDEVEQEKWEEDALQHVVLAAHWDSKLEPRGMLGAMDSAVSLLLLQQCMQELLWWREMNLLVRMALRDRYVQEDSNSERHAKVLHENDFWTVSLEDLTSESEVRDVLQEVLSPTLSSALLEYVFPSGLSEKEDPAGKNGVPNTNPKATLSSAWFTELLGKKYSVFQWLVQVERLPHLSVLFLDGEEAFVEWKGQDHTYGSRHLAEVWKHKPWKARHKTMSVNTTSSFTWYNSVDSFILLDLIGGSDDHRLRNLFPHLSGELYQQMVKVESTRRQTAKHHLAFRKPMAAAPETSFCIDSHRNASRLGAPGGSSATSATWTTVLPAAWAQYGIPPVWYHNHTGYRTKSSFQISLPASCTAPDGSVTSCPYFSLRESQYSRDTPVIPSGELIVEDDHMHWLDAGRTVGGPVSLPKEVSSEALSKPAGVKDKGDGNTLLSVPFNASERLDNAEKPAMTKRQAVEQHRQQKREEAMAVEVNMLHLIPLPFPSQWHTLFDDAEHISWDATVNFYHIFMTFLLFPVA